MRGTDWGKERVTALLETSKAVRITALMALYKSQTANEVASQATRDANGVGFNQADAEILTSIARQIEAGRTVSAKQMQVLRNRLPKYWRQIGPLMDPRIEAAMQEQEERDLFQGSW